MNSLPDPAWLRRKLREELRKKNDPSAPVKKMRKEVRKVPTSRKK